MFGKKKKDIIPSFNWDDPSIVNRISLCIWCDGPGRPHDNLYLLTNKIMDDENNTLTLFFENNEKCTIINPLGIEWQSELLTVKSADTIIWENYYYGIPQTPETLVILEYHKIDNSHVHVMEKGMGAKRNEIINTLGSFAIRTL